MKYEKENYIYKYIICPKCGEKIELERKLSGYTATVPPEEAKEIDRS